MVLTPRASLLCGIFFYVCVLFGSQNIFLVLSQAGGPTESFDKSNDFICMFALFVAVCQVNVSNLFWENKNDSDLCHP